MLTIEKKNTPLTFIVTIIIAAVTATLTTFIILILLEAWTQHLCSNVSLADYANRNAPSKCQTLWYEGRL